MEPNLDPSHPASMSQSRSREPSSTTQVKTIAEYSAPEDQERLPFFGLPAELRLGIWKQVLNDAESRTVFLYISADAEFDEKFPTWQLKADVPALLHVCAESRVEALKVYKPSFKSPSPGLLDHPAFFNGERDLLFFAPFEELEERWKAYEYFLDGEWDMRGDLQTIRRLALDCISPPMFEFFHSKRNDEAFESICYIKDDTDFGFPKTPRFIDNLEELRGSLPPWEGDLLTRFEEMSLLFRRWFNRVHPYITNANTIVPSMKFALLLREE
jgi:hypothetical protein